MASDTIQQEIEQQNGDETMYPVAVTVGPGDILAGESIMSDVQRTFGNASFTIWVTGNLTEDQIRSVFKSEDIRPYLGTLKSHWEGPSIINDGIAMRFIDDVARMHSQHSEGEYRAKDWDDISKDGWGQFLAIVHECVNMDWEPQWEIVAAAEPPYLCICNAMDLSLILDRK